MRFVRGRSQRQTERYPVFLFIQQWPEHTPGDCTFGLTNPANLPPGRDLVLGPARNCSPIVSVSVTFGLARFAVGAQGGRQIGDCLAHSSGQSFFSHRGLLFGLAAGVEDDGGHVLGGTGRRRRIGMCRERQNPRARIPHDVWDGAKPAGWPPIRSMGAFIVRPPISVRC